MKRFLSWTALLLLSAGMLSACQETPETPVVMQKDQQQMLETARGDGQPRAGEAAALRERLGAPETLSETVSLLDGKLLLELDAAVLLPETDAVPVARVEPADFTETQAAFYFDRLCGGLTMYDSEETPTKATLERWIVEAKAAMSDPANADDPEYLSDLAASVERFQSMYRTAPETWEPTRITSGVLKETAICDRDGRPIAYQRALSAQTQDGTFFSLYNNSDLKAFYAMDYEPDGSVSGGMGVSRRASLSFSRLLEAQVRNRSNWFTPPLVWLTDMDAVPAEAAGKLRITPKEACAAAEPLVADSGLACAGVYLTSDYAPGFDPERTPDSALYAYQLVFTRLVSGVPCAISPETFPSDTDWTAPQWYYESATALVDDSGILQFNWTSPVQVAEILVEDAALLPFAEILRVFEKLAGVAHAYEVSYDNVRCVTYRIDRVELSLQRVAQQNSIETALLVPAWSFYGGSSTAFADGSVLQTGGGYSLPDRILTINAIDGAVINPTKGY